MKYILLFIIIFGVGSIKDIGIDDYSATGHDQFSEIELVNDDAYLLNSLSDETIDKELSNLSNKFWGNREVILNEYEDATYVSNVIFSRINHTREPYIFSYDTTTIEYSAVSVEINGSLSVKDVYKGKKNQVTGEAKLSGSYNTNKYDKTTEAGSLDVVIYPSKKVMLRIVGDAKVSNGASKYYICWICCKAGTWEIINVLNMSYELVEEDA